MTDSMPDIRTEGITKVCDEGNIYIENYDVLRNLICNENEITERIKH